VSRLTVCHGFHARARASAVCGSVFVMVGEFKWSDVEGSPLTIIAILLSSASLLFTVSVVVAIKFAVIFVGFQGGSCMRLDDASTVIIALVPALGLLPLECGISSASSSVDLG
jgi:hypothetical protein